MDLKVEIDTLRRKLHDLQRQVAGVMPPETPPDGQLSLLIAQVGRDRVALLLRGVQEVVPLPRLKPIPETPHWFLGLLNLRSQLIPIIDVQARIAQRARTPHLSDLIVVAQGAQCQVGLLVQSIEAVSTASREHLEELPPGLPRAPYLMGTIHLTGQPALLLSIQQLAALADIPEADA